MTSPQTIAPIVRIHQVSKTYRATGQQSAFPAVRSVSLDIQAGSFSALMGPSGSGKTTLLNLTGGLDRPDVGSIEFEGRDISSLNDRTMSRLRLERIGYIFQFFNLLPALTARLNVELPLRLLGMPAGKVQELAQNAIARVGLASKIDRFPHQLSGGEMQRIAIARALAHRPSLILADEPTGNLDSANGQSILELLRELVETEGVTVLMATHDPRGREVCHRVFNMMDGQLVHADRLDPVAASAD